MDGMAVLRRRFENEMQGPRGVMIDEFARLPRDISVWCFEGQNHLAARRKLFPGYKDRPSTMTDGLFALVDVTRRMLQHTRALQVAVPGMEADDVIAHLAAEHSNADNVVIYTVDRDLKALEGPNVRVDCGPVKVRLTAGDPTSDVTIPPEQIRLYKTLVGDTSDRIPGLPGFGPKAYLACRPALLQVAMLGLVAGNREVEPWVRAGMKEATATRLVTADQSALIRAYWNIIGFQTLPSTWQEHITVGKLDRAAADACLREHMQ
jgi:hypothetical protein